MSMANERSDAQGHVTWKLDEAVDNCNFSKCLGLSVAWRKGKSGGSDSLKGRYRRSDKAVNAKNEIHNLEDNVSCVELEKDKKVGRDGID
jgi:hypothetical protein